MNKLISLTDDVLIKRMRWVMVAAIVFTIINTLAAQPASYWNYPATAIRSDGLSIYTATNPAFDFFLGQGWLAYLGADIVYIVMVFLAASIFPRTIALIMMFTVVMMHCFDGCNWLAVRWHLGIQGTVIYCGVLAFAVAAAVLSVIKDAGPLVRKLRWVLVMAQMIDVINTLLGQPASYWQNPLTVHEGNALSYFFLSHGYLYYCCYNFAVAAVTVWLVTILPASLALTWVFAGILGGFIGGSNWFFYEWRMGIMPLFIYAITLSILIAMFGFSHRQPGSKLSIGELSCNEC